MPPPNTDRPPPDHISGQDVCDRLFCTYHQLRGLVKQGRIGVRRLPGIAYDRYCRRDVGAIAAADITPAREAPTWSAPSKARTTKGTLKPGHKPVPPKPSAPSRAATATTSKPRRSARAEG